MNEKMTTTQEQNVLSETTQIPANVPISAGVTGSTLKLIAISTMVIDHIGAGFLTRYLASNPANEILWNAIYLIMRCIGRIAFPIFCFLLVEGFLHTHSVKKYASRMFAFCILSEIPFDFCFFGKLYLGYQNVFFTLLFGLLTIAAIDFVSKKELEKAKYIACVILISLFGMAIAELLSTDYGMKGVFCIVILYLLKHDRKKQLIGSALSFFFEFPFAQLAFIPLAKYNGKRGLSLKYLFYFFYPVHLALIYAVVYFCGLAGYPAM